MDTISFDIDLRSSEYKNKGRFIKPSTVKALILFLVLFSPVGFLYGMSLYASSTERNIALLEKQISDLAQSAGPVIAISDEIDHLRDRADLEKQLLGLFSPWSFYFRELKSIAPPTISIETMTANPDRVLKIKGSSTSIEAAARYKLNIENLSFTRGTELAAITMNPAGSYNFQIISELISGEGVDRDN